MKSKNVNKKEDAKKTDCANRKESYASRRPLQRRKRKNVDLQVLSVHNVMPPLLELACLVVAAIAALVHVLVTTISLIFSQKMCFI